MISKSEFRIHSYTLFSLAFNYPNETLVNYIEHIDELEPLLAYAREYLTDYPDVAHSLAALINLDNTPSLLDLEREYTRLCHATKPRLVPLFASVYTDGRLLRESTREVALLYDQAGLKLNEKNVFPPDNVAYEFEFMTYLAVQEMQNADSTNDTAFLNALDLQKKMLTDHISKFSDEFARRMNEHSRIEFYRLASQYMALFVQWDIKQIQEVPELV